MTQHESATQITTEIDPAEVLKAYLETMRRDWSPHYHKAMRDGRQNAELNAAADHYVPAMDAVLDELGRLSIINIQAATA